MTQDQFNETVINILQALADHAHIGNFSQPKHGIVGTEVGDMIQQLRCNTPVEKAK